MVHLLVARFERSSQAGAKVVMPSLGGLSNHQSGVHLLAASAVHDAELAVQLALAASLLDYFLGAAAGQEEQWNALVCQLTHC